MSGPVLKTAEGFGAGNVAYLQEKFGELLGKPINFTVETDLSLIGGFVAYIDGRVYDAAIKTQLSRFKAGFPKNKARFARER